MYFQDHFCNENLVNKMTDHLVYASQNKTLCFSDDLRISGNWFFKEFLNVQSEVVHQALFDHETFSFLGFGLFTA